MATIFITVREAAELKGVSRAAVYAAVKDGRLPSQLQLGKIGLRKSDVVEWIPVPHEGKRRAIKMSEAAKARISASQKARWAKRKGG